MSAFTFVLLKMKSLIFDLKIFFIFILIVFIILTATMDDSSLLLWEAQQQKIYPSGPVQKHLRLYYKKRGYEEEKTIIIF